MDIDPPHSPQISESNSRKRALSNSVEHAPSGKKQNKMATNKLSHPPFPTPSATPAHDNQHSRNEAPDVRNQDTPHDEDIYLPGPPTGNEGEEAVNISDLEYAQAKTKGRVELGDPFSTPTHDALLKKQASADQAYKPRPSRHPIGHPSHLDPQLSKNSSGKHHTAKKQQPPAPGTPVAHLSQPGSMPNPTLLSQILPTSEDGVIALGDFKYTEYPRNDPHLYPQLGQNNFLFLQPQQVLTWNSKKGNKVLVREFHAKYETDVQARRKTRDNIEETLIGFLGEGSTFDLSDPKAMTEKERAKTDPPWHTLAYNLSNAHYIKLMAHPIIATPKCVLIIAPFHQIIPTFIASVTGLTCRGNSPSGQKIAMEAVRQGLMSDTPLASDFDLIAGTGTFQKLINELNVYFVNTSEAHPNEGWWNVESSGMPKNITIEQYQVLTARIKKLTFPTEDYGDGTALPRSRECINCKCISHTVNLCPLYNMKGWLGPPKPIPDDNARNFAKYTRGRPRGGGAQTGRGNGNKNQNSARGMSRRS